MLDLGELFNSDISSPVLLFGGPYSNLQALEALKHTAEQYRIPPSRCICTGDIVAYCAQPAETVSTIRDWGVHCLMGNCEESLSEQADDCGCGFEEGTQCDVLSNQWFQFTKQTLTPKDRQWFASLPREIIFSASHKSCHVIHGGLSVINRFLFPSSDDAFFEEELSLSTAEVIIGGHCGIPFNKVFTGNGKKRLWHNTGAIGMPANDGSRSTWFSLLSINSKGQLTITHHTLSYDHQTAYTEMQKVNMDNGYADALLSGLWPSMDVLPEQEKKHCGTPITPSSVTLT